MKEDDFAQVPGTWMMEPPLPQPVVFQVPVDGRDDHVRELELLALDPLKP